MWFYFGLITVSVSLIVYLYQKLSIKSALQMRKTALQNWTFDKTQLRYLLTNATDKNRGLFVIEIPCLTTLQFSARQELQKDKWAKRLGVSYEFETGSQPFDEQTYLASITQEDAEIIGTNKEIIAEIRDLIFKNQDINIVAKRTMLICDGEHLYLELHFKKDSAKKDINVLAAYYLPKLNALANHLECYKRESQHFWKVPAQRNTAIFLAISWALATWGGLEAIRFFIVDKNALFSPLSLMPEASILAIFLLLALLFFAFRLIKKSARRHLVLIDILIFGGLGLLFSVYGMLYDLNLMKDYSKASIVNYQVASKYSESHRGRKGRTYYTYHFKLNNAVEPVESTIKVGHDFYNEIAEGDFITFTIRDGYLNKVWLEKLEKCNKCDLKSESEQNSF
ncbi:MAG TPA: hypothetical protein PL131_08385 [Methylotenera sp.]|nr:hypothetical protein [Methylotenera sp.]HPH05876.1 hypothetical protein [Methylotenera sp.]HPN00658.1 hypothetical protein [Methylotenera sp.]